MPTPPFLRYRVVYVRFISAHRQYDAIDDRSDAMTRNLIATIATFACLQLATANATPPDTSPYSTALHDAQHWGQQMYDLDQAAWKGTDDVLAKIPDTDKARLRGWITEQTDAGIRVVFVGEDKGRVVALFEVTPSASIAVTKDDPARVLTADELAAYTARQTALAAHAPRCTESVNVVVAREDAGKMSPWRVYLMPGTTDPALIPMGGFHLFHISADGATILSQRAFTKSCLNMRRDAGPAGSQQAGLFVTHMLDPQPTEAHVFTSLSFRVPIFVGTASNNVLWEVSGASIEAKDVVPEPPAANGGGR